MPKKGILHVILSKRITEMYYDLYCSNNNFSISDIAWAIEYCHKYHFAFRFYRWIIRLPKGERIYRKSMKKSYV